MRACPKCGAESSTQKDDMEVCSTCGGNILRLWENDRYKCHQPGVRLEPGMRLVPPVTFESWAEFIRDQSHPDWGNEDYNMLVKWDWVDEVLQLTYLQQRLGRLLFVQVSVSEEDEPAVRAFLKPKLDYLIDAWSPL